MDLLTAKKAFLALPDVLITSVGTQVFCRDKDHSAVRFVEDEEWIRRLSYKWDLGIVREITYKLLAEYGDESIHFRPPREQNEHKVTLGVCSSIVHEVEDRIRKGINNVENVDKNETRQISAKVIVSGEGNWRFLDIIPQRAGKFESMQYVREHLGFVAEEVVCCGDSGNDKSMLDPTNFSKSIESLNEISHIGVVVANAQPDLMEWALAQSKELEAGASSRLFISRGSHAEGILEALSHYGFR